jgi:hypothetical protein
MSAGSRIGEALPGLFRAVTEEAAANPGFAARLEEALAEYAEAFVERRRAERRIAGFHPVVEARHQDEEALRQRLGGFDTLELRMIVEAHGLDPARILKARSSKKALVEHVLKAARRRVQRDAQLFEY